MARFTPGQHVVCIDKSNWMIIDHQHKTPTAGPHYLSEEIVTGNSHYKGEDYIALKGHKGYFCEESFEPLITDQQLHKVLLSTPHPQLYV